MDNNPPENPEEQEAVKEAERILNEAKNKPAEESLTVTEAEKIVKEARENPSLVVSEQTSKLPDHEQKFEESELRVLAPGFTDAFFNALMETPQAQQAMLENFKRNLQSSYYGNPDHFEFTASDGSPYRFSFTQHSTDDVEKSMSISRMSKEIQGAAEEIFEAQVARPGSQENSHILYWAPDVLQEEGMEQKASLNTGLAFNRANAMLKQLGGQEVSQPVPKPNSPQ